MATELAAIGFALDIAVMSRYLLTLWAVDSLWPSGIFKKIEAGIISGELPFKVFNSVGFHYFLQSRFMPTLYHNISLLSRDNCQFKSWVNNQ